MQKKTKNDGIISGAKAHSVQRLRGPWPRLATTGVENLKKKPFERKRPLCCESFLAGTQVQIQYLFIITVGNFWNSERWDSLTSQVTAKFGSSLCLYLVITEITSKLTFQCLYSNLPSCQGLLQSKFEWNVAMETKHYVFLGEKLWINPVRQKQVKGGKMETRQITHTHFRLAFGGPKKSF